MIETFFSDERHRQSEELAFIAERADRQGDQESSTSQFARAAKLEEEVAKSVPSETPRIRTVLAVSAVSLWMKAKRWSEAARAGAMFLSAPDGLTPDGQTDLEILTERAWRLRDLSSESSALSGYAPLEAKLDGGQIRKGLAPTSLVRDRSAVIVPLLLRVAEFTATQKFRKGGLSALARRYEVVEAPALAASYTVRLFLGVTADNVGKQSVKPQQVIEQFLRLASAAARGSEELRALVPDEDYAKAFTRGFRDLAADGDSVGSVELSSGRGREAPVSLTPSVRERLSSSLQPTPAQGEFTVVGVLRSIKLGTDPKIGVKVDRSRLETFRLRLGDHDDTIGPKLNKPVRVHAWRLGAESWAADVMLLDQNARADAENDQEDERFSEPPQDPPDDERDG